MGVIYSREKGGWINGYKEINSKILMESVSKCATLYETFEFHVWVSSGVVFMRN